MGNDFHVADGESYYSQKHLAADTLPNSALSGGARSAETKPTLRIHPMVALLRPTMVAVKTSKSKSVA